MGSGHNSPKPISFVAPLSSIALVPSPNMQTSGYAHGPFIVEDAQSEETMLHSFHYYEKITTHDSSLSYCIFSIMAARLGMPEKAYAYYELTANLDLSDRHGNTADGIHVANMAAIIWRSSTDLAVFVSKNKVCRWRRSCPTMEWILFQTDI
jgi:hypothetical protein